MAEIYLYQSGFPKAGPPITTAKIESIRPIGKDDHRVVEWDGEGVGTLFNRYTVNFTGRINITTSFGDSEERIEWWGGYEFYI